MLEKLLNLLREEGIKSVRELSEKLEITPNLVLFMLEDLENRGFIRKINFRSNSPCTKCPLSDLCQGNKDQRVWVFIK